MKADTVETPGTDKRISRLRVLAILMVVLGHSIIIYSHGWNLYRPAMPCPAFDKLKIVIDNIQMPLFFSISGYLLPLTLSHEDLTFMGFLKQKTVRLLVPFLFVAYCWMLPIKEMVHYPSYAGKPFLTVIARYIFLGEDVGHLWFLPALLFIFIGMWFICRFAVPRIGVIPIWVILFLLSLFSRRFITFNVFIQDACIYAVWFFTGYMLHTRRECRHASMAKATLAVLAVLLEVVLVLIEPHLPSSVFVVVGMGVSLIAVVALYEVMPAGSGPVTEFLAPRSFGLYLFHSPLVYITYTYWSYLNPLLVFAINFFVMGSIALAVTGILLRTPLRVLIGEKLHRR